MHETGFTQSVIKSERLHMSGEKHDDDDDNLLRLEFSTQSNALQ
jgi:hypothetical protein